MQPMMLSEACMSDLALDEWFSRELDADTEADAAAHFATCARCRARRDALQRERDAFLAAAPSFDAHARLIAGEPRAPRRSRARAWIGGGVLAAAALALLALPPLRDQLATRSKGGGPHVGFFVKRGAQISRGSSGEAVQPGNLVRFTYSSERARYFALLNLDARSASIYYPAGAMAMPVRAGIDVPLDFSVELDAELGAEHVYAVFCEQPFALEPLRAQLQASQRLDPPVACEVDSIALVKEARR